MKKTLFLVFTICFIISLYLTKNMMNDKSDNSCGRIGCHGGICPYALKNSEGTSEDPAAKLRYDWMRFREPSSNQIPSRMRFKENEFVNSRFGLLHKSSLTTSHEWTSQGPFLVGGRIKALGIDIDDENVIIVGCSSGGAWKSSDGGHTWVKTTLPNQLQSVTCIAQNKSQGKHNIWYYGTGEYLGGPAAWPVAALYTGDGIFKSTDNGDSWTLLSSTSIGVPHSDADFSYVYKIETFDEDGVIAATSRGIFRSTNGGSTWHKVISSTLQTAYTQNITTDVAITSQGVYYATIATTVDYPDVTVNQGIFRSINGVDWINITPTNWLAGTKKTEITPLPTNENIIFFFACLSTTQTALMTYEHGTGWTDISSKLPWNGQISTYNGNMQVFKIKPDDPNTMFVSGIDLSRTTNNGLSWESSANLTNSYVDQMDIIFSRNNPNRMYLANDGGIWKVENCSGPLLNANNVIGLPFESLNNGILSTQFYSVSLDNGNPNSNVILGGMQDQGVYARRSFAQNGWERIFSGDGGYTAISSDGEYYYLSMASAQYLARIKSDLSEFTPITPSNTYMTYFISPFILDPFDNKMMYVACRDNSGPCIYRNSDLTQIPYFLGSPLTTSINWSKIVSFENNETCTALGMSPTTPRRLYLSTSSNNGVKLYMLDNPQLSQPQLVELNLPQLDFYERIMAFICCISVDPYNPNKVIIVFSNYGMQSIYYSEDGCNTWEPVSGNLEDDLNGRGNGPSVRWLSVLYVQGQPIYFAGTSVGLFSTTRLNGMNTTWAHEGSNTIGNIPIDMIAVRESDGCVAVGTVGNGVYTTYITQIPATQQANVMTSSNPPDGGTVNGSGTFDIGSRLTLVASPNVGFRFLNWTENNNIVSTNESYTFILNSDRYLIANFGLIPALLISPENVSVSSVQAEGSFNVTNTTGGSMNWSAISNSSWITIISGSSGINNGTVVFRVEENTGEERIGTITVTANNAIGSPKNFEITQTIATNLEEFEIPTSYCVSQNYPNPFNPSTTIRYSIPEAGFVTLKVYDLLGNEVATLVNEFKQPGTYTSQFSLHNSRLTSGIYFYKITAGKYSETKKMIILK